MPTFSGLASAVVSAALFLSAIDVIRPPERVVAFLFFVLLLSIL